MKKVKNTSNIIPISPTPIESVIFPYDYIQIYLVLLLIVYGLMIIVNLILEEELIIAILLVKLIVL
jgi:hypothetical protein